jgi:polyisoprenoid-binding protein YceI
MMKKIAISVLCFLALAGVPRMAAADNVLKWTPDLIHSRAEFTVSHVVLSKVWGHLPIRDLQITTAGSSLVPTSVSALLDVSHLDTDNHTRDADLRSETYFDVATYPTMSFSSTNVKPTDADDFVMTGNLTIKNITKSVKIPVHIIGHIPDDAGTRVGYEGKITIDRRDFGITDSRLLGGVLFVGYQVDIGITAEASSTLRFHK